MNEPTTEASTDTSQSDEQQFISKTNKEMMSKINSMRIVQTIPRFHTAYVSKVLLTKDKTKLITISNSNTILIRQFGRDCRILRELKGHNNQIVNMILLESGRLATASTDDSIKIWNILTGSCEMTIQPEKWIRTILEINKDVFLTGSYGNVICKWEINSEEKESEEKSVTRKELVSRVEQRECQCMIRFSENEILASSDLEVHLYSFNPTTIDDFKLERTLRGHRDYVLSIKKIRDDLVLTGGSDRTVKLWNPKSPPNVHPLLRSLGKHTNYVSAEPIVFLDLFIVTCSKELKIWNLEDDQDSDSIRDIKQGKFIWTAIKVNENAMLTGGTDNKLKLWKF